MIDTFDDLPPLVTKQVHSKYSIRDILPPIAKPLNPLKATCSTSYLLHLTRTWDQGNRSIRERILAEFIKENRYKTGPQLEKELNNGASLFLTRITAWLRLTYLLGHCIALQLEAISIFISSSSGNRFLGEFLEVGGILTILEILGIPQAKEKDKAEALRLLLFISSNGRRYKEFICESFGVRSIAECLTKSKSDVTQDYARNLLSQLGTGNPKYIVQIYKSLITILSSPALPAISLQMAAQALRMILPNINSFPTSIIESSINLLQNTNVQVQYEGYELLKELIQKPSLQDTIIRELISILRIVIKDDEDELDLRQRRVKGGLESVGWQKNTPKEDQKQMQAVYVQQAYAAKLLSFAAASSREVAEKIIQNQVLGALLNTIANIGHPESQRYATNLLMFICHHFDYVVYALCEQMGHKFYELIEAKPDTFYRELTKDQVKYLRKNQVKISDSHRNQLPEVFRTNVDDNQDVDEVGPMFPSFNENEEGIAQEDSDANDFGSDILVEENPVIVEEYEKTASEIQKPLVEEIYTPFVQNKIMSTFSGTKYNSVTNVEPNQKFTSDLEHLRESNKKSSKTNNRKDEFKIDVSADMTSKIVNIRDDPNLFSVKSIPSPVALPPKELAQVDPVKNEILEEVEEENS